MSDKVKQLEKRRASLEGVRESYKPDWLDIAQHFMPRGGRFITSDSNQGHAPTKRIIDHTPVKALNIASSAMVMGTANPARPWFDMKFRSPKLVDNQAGKAYLQDTKDVLANVLLKSNFYDQLPRLIRQGIAFGSGAMAVLEDEDDVVRFETFPIGSYSWACNHKGRIDTFCRIYRMTLRQMAQQFGAEKLTETQRRNLEDPDKAENPVEVVWQVYPNDDYKPKALHAKHKRVASCYYQTSGNQSESAGILRESGFDEFPILAFRWSVTSNEDAWGTGPGHEVLDDTKELFQLHLMKAKGASRQIAPPLIAPSWMAGKRLNLLPDQVTTAQGPETAGLRSIYEGQTFDGTMMLELINDVRQRIRSGLFEDLFLMFANSDRREITAAEIVARNQEKVLVLANVLERLNQEVFDPLIDRLFSVTARRGLLPEPPEDLIGEDIAVEYISTMAQESKQTGLAAIDRFAGFVSQLAQVNPAALDKVDFDQAIDEVGAMLGIPARIIKPDEVVANERAQRAQAAQQQAAIEQINQASVAAKNLSQADTTGQTVLADLMAGGIR